MHSFNKYHGAAATTCQLLPRVVGMNQLFRHKWDHRQDISMYMWQRLPAFHQIPSYSREDSWIHLPTSSAVRCRYVPEFQSMKTRRNDVHYFQWCASEILPACSLLLWLAGMVKSTNHRSSVLRLQSTSKAWKKAALMVWYVQDWYKSRK